MSSKPTLRILTSIAVAAFLQSATGCKTSNKGTKASHVKFGFLKPSAQHLIQLPSGSQIRICGGHFDELKNAILKWAAAIDRTYDIVNKCESEHIQSFLTDEAFAKTNCSRWNIEARMYSESDKTPMRVVDCNIAKDRVPFAILHEVGHLFGLCDQYPGEVGRCVYSTDVVPGSVMHQAGSMQLQPDDIDGIRALAQKYPTTN